MSNISEFEDIKDVSLVNKSADELMNLARQTYEEEWKRQTGEDISLMPADKARIVLQTVVYMVMMNLIAADQMYQKTTLKGATGDALDHIGVTRCGVKRPEDKAATVPIKYIFDGALTESITIPSGNRVSVGNVYFATTEATVVPAGSTYKTVICTCTQTGTIGNGYTAGTITTHTDPLAYVKEVTNTETSQGGISPSDDDYTDLIYNTPEGWAVAGPVEAYKAKAKEFNPSIADVSVEMPDDEVTFEYDIEDNDETTTVTNSINLATGELTTEDSNITDSTIDLSGCDVELNFTTAPTRIKFHVTPGGRVNIYPLLLDSEIPSQTFLTQLENYLSADEIRPLTDKVKGIAPSQSSYTINFSYYIDKKNQNKVDEIRAAVDEAVAEYKRWQNAKMGRDIDPQELIRLCKNAGAKRLIITTPTFTSLNSHTVAKCTSTSVTYSGLEE